MSQKRTSEHEFVEEAKKRPKKTHGAAVTVGDDLHEDGTLDSSTQATTMKQLEDYVRAGNQAAARQLLAQETVDLKSPEGGDLLWTAYALDMPEMVAMLVHYEADLSVRKHLDNRTLLHHVLRGSRIESVVTRNLVSLMLDFGADVDARDSKGKSLLHDAITSSHQGSAELVKELLKRGAEITVNKENRQMDDVCATCMHKLDLLPMLILHQEPDEKTRHRRAFIAIEFLMSKNYPGAKRAMLLMIKKILDLCMPVNDALVFKTQPEKQQFSFLNLALWHENKAVIKLLLEYGEHPDQYNMIGHTTLYQATAFKGDTQVCRWLIERGVSIQARNYNGDYPVHGACTNESVKNLHLLLNLGADLNCTDRYGQTPFGLIRMSKKRKDREVHNLIVKNFALMTARGKIINKKDRAKIDGCTWSKNYLKKCTNQLKQMKVEKVHGDVFYFSLLSLNIYSIMQLMKNPKFVSSFKRDEKKQSVLFSDYFYMLSHSFEVAKKQLQVLLAEKKKLCEAFKGTLPDSTLEKMAYYSCFDRLKQCHNDYFMSFHDKLNNSKRDRKKIL